VSGNGRSRSSLATATTPTTPSSHSAIAFWTLPRQILFRCLFLLMYHSKKIVSGISSFLWKSLVWSTLFLCITQALNM
jgi:hypothetical protein